MNHMTKFQSSFDDDSLFTEDILEDVSKIECDYENRNLPSVGQEHNLFGIITNDCKFSSKYISNTNISRTQNATGILPKQCRQNKVIKTDNIFTTRHSKRVLNKHKLKYLSNSLEKSCNSCRPSEKENQNSECNTSEISVVPDSSHQSFSYINKEDKVYNSSVNSNIEESLSKNANTSLSQVRQLINDQSIEIYKKSKPRKLECNDVSQVLKRKVDSFNDSNTENSSFLRFEHKLELSSLGLPKEVLEKYNENGISRMFPWQVECLSLPGVLEGQNLIYSAPTSAGKTLVAEIILLKRVLEQKKKGIFILPFVSIAREKTYSLQRLFGVSGVRVEGFMGGQSPPGGFQKTDIAICTIEKANNIINKLIEDEKVDELGIIVVDELHMVGDSHRGYLLELLLTKLQFVTSVSKKASQIQIIGMSATLPNLHVLADWQKAELYSTTFRPIPLLQMVKIGTTLYKEDFSILRNLETSEMIIKDDGEQLVQLCLETIIEGFSVLIFCPTKAWCEKISLSIASSFYSIGKNDSTYHENLVMGIRNRLNGEDLRKVIEALQACPAGLDPVLERSLAFGAAFHHAGLTFDERDIIEGAFRAGYLPVLAATSTLSSGVNLPARRVIIRSPNSGGQLMDPLVYKQMIGRAGRKGKDTEGESILMCGLNEKYKAELLVKAMLSPITSCLQKNTSLTSCLKRAVLEIVVSGAAKSMDDIKLYWNCTLSAATFKSNQDTDEEKESPKPAVEECVQYLLDNELARYEELNGETILTGSPLGSAILASGLSPDEGLHVFSELQRARQCFVLENELHVVYQVTPIYVSDAWPNLDWLQFLEIWEKLSGDMKKVGELVGVQESFIVRAMKGTVNCKIAKQRNMLAIHQRFYASLALHDLVHEVSLPSVVSKYGATKGLLQALQQSAATFAGMVTVFCNRLGWHNLELLIAQYQNRLQFGIQRDLCDLVKITLLNGYRARILFEAGLQSVNQIAHSNSKDIESLLQNGGPFQSHKHGNYSGGFILGPSGSPMSFAEASESIVNEARELVQKELGLNNIDWSNKNVESPELEENYLSESRSIPNCEYSSKDSLENTMDSIPDKCSNSRKRMSSGSSSEKRLSKSSKLSNETEFINQISLPLSNEKKHDIIKCVNFPSPVSSYKQIAKSKEKFLKLPKEGQSGESGYSSEISLHNTNQESNTGKGIVDELEPNASSTPSNIPNSKLVKDISKSKSKGSFLFAKSSRSKPKLIDSACHSTFSPDSQETKTTKSNRKSLSVTDKNIKQKIMVHENLLENEMAQNSSVEGNKSTMLSDSLRAELLETMREDDMSFIIKQEKSKRDSTQSEDFFGLSSDEENVGAHDKSEDKYQMKNLMLKRNSIDRKHLRTPIYSVCTEEIDFGFDLSKTEKRGSLGREKRNTVFQNESFFSNEYKLDINDFDHNKSLNNDSIIMTESGALSLTRENIEKDLNEFESSILEKSNSSENFNVSKMESFFDKAFDYHSINDSLDDHLAEEKKEMFYRNNINSNSADFASSSIPKSSNDFSTLILTPRTEEIMLGEAVPNKNIQDKEFTFRVETNLESKSSILADLKVDSESTFSQSVSRHEKPLAIIDVTSDEKLFDVFIEEWRSKDTFSLSLACENASNFPKKEGIGWRLCGRSLRTPQKKPVAGLVIERSQLLLTGIAVSWGGSDSYFINLKRNKENGDVNDSIRDALFPTPPISREVSLQQRINFVRSVLGDGSVNKTIRMWNVKETIKLLHRSGIAVSDFSFQDPRVALWLLDPTAKQKNIHNMVLSYCEEYSHLFEHVGSILGLGSMGISSNSTKEYSGSVRMRSSTECVLIFHLAQALENSLASSDLKEVYEAVEMPSIYNLTIMELNGMGFCQKECKEQKHKLEEKLHFLETEAYKILGRRFNISSPDEVSKILYGELNLQPSSEQHNLDKRRRGPLRSRRMVKGPTNKEVLEKLKDKHPLPGIILEWRRINSALSKIVYPLIQEMVSCVSLGEDRIFPICNTFTATGRVTLHEPNVQYIPKDFIIDFPNRGGNCIRELNVTSVMKQLEPLLVPLDKSSYNVSLRHAIVAGKNRVLLASDYSQLELRILAHLSHDANLLKTLNDGEDVFKNIASRIHTTTLLKVTDNMRQEAKQICYGIIYGMSEKSLGDQLAMDQEAAKNFITQFHHTFPLISKFINSTVEEARKKGYVITLEGRKRFLPGINSSSLAIKGQCERQAVNTRIQGSAADLVKKALKSIQQKLRENFPLAPKTLTQRLEKHEVLSGGYLILQLHDELIYEVANDDVVQVAQIVRESMESAANLSVCLPVKIKVGPTWGTVQVLNL